MSNQIFAGGPTPEDDALGRQARFRRAPRRSTPSSTRLTPFLKPTLRRSSRASSRRAASDVRRRVFGIETEYGLTAASPSGGAPMDAEHAARQLFEPLLHQGRSSNLFLRNGGRLYLDVGAHPEYATAECDRLEDLLEQDRAGASMLADLAVQADAALSELGSDLRLHLFRNNLDSQGNSYGCHENYLLHRRRDFRQVADALVAFFVTRQILVGNGWINTAAATPRLQFSQRADQMWDAVSSATTRSRPIINTRDEALADSGAYRRMHVIVGDTNVAEPTTALKVGMTELLIHAIEDGLQIQDLALADPMRAIREVNSDLSGSAPLSWPTDARRAPSRCNERSMNVCLPVSQSRSWILCAPTSSTCGAGASMPSPAVTGATSTPSWTSRSSTNFSRRTAHAVGEPH